MSPTIFKTHSKQNKLWITIKWLLIQAGISGNKPNHEFWYVNFTIAWGLIRSLVQNFVTRWVDPYWHILETIIQISIRIYFKKLNWKCFYVPYGPYDMVYNIMLPEFYRYFIYTYSGVRKIDAPKIDAFSKISRNFLKT